MRWALAVVHLGTLLIGVGLVAFYVAGEGSPLGLVAGAAIAVLAVRSLQELEPRLG